MQCGVCSGSCPFGPHWEHPPQEIFMMIRAGKRDEVLKSDSMWMCTSCYNCIVRCPRKLPITHIMHGLAELRAPPRHRAQEPADARVRQAVLEQPGQDRARQRAQADRWAMYFKDGIGHGIKNGHGDAERRPRPVQGQAPQPDGDARRPQAART
ncbi:MAG: 4Fe-4S dicluster domain-containing protein [Chromatiales bacterium]|nr:4Fe-4S dicluster domain-containing protein [Chromatiales bacterium]